MGMGFGGMGFMPMAYGMFNPPSLSRTDAAALNMTPQSATGFGVMNPSTNIFANPFAAPMVYGSMAGSPYGMTQRQAGLMMLAGSSQAMLGGVGSGQLSGVRPGSRGQAKGQTTQRTAARTPGTSSTPGGLAARYFNRTAPSSRYPQSFYNRQTRYFPQITR
jgi:hypothetical protein